ncbi:YcaO-like family protein [Sphingobium sp. AP49]|uniref:YcaO-like family protein n=1 Tax=Sphingobium sp. AP49 TaxID=1144307 RepID=UPI00026EDB31|nr:YcaO-like family protein [Sphingobium sp. AP49]WHO38559.1 YcaO-like family protein [Sphingobium sp. AP49]
MKPFRRGAHRSRRPADTLARVAPVARALGVTRLADITGLDRIGIPVFQAVRPLSLSLSVSQGKGATPDAARVSALMEAIELHHAETCRPTSHAVPNDGEARLWSGMTQADQQASRFDPARARGWVDGVDLLSGRPLRVPHGLVSMDFTIVPESDLWPNSNGLASGNSLAEARVSALCEAIERDGHARWLERGPRARRASALDVDSITDRLGRWLIARVRRAGFSLSLWDMTGPTGVAVIGCSIIELGAARTVVLPPAMGAGCHPDAGVALARAICEAAQTRAALIAGARDDIDPTRYIEAGEQRTGFMLSMLDFAPARRPWSSVPSHSHRDSEADLAWMLERCAEQSLPAVACVDLTRADIGIDVVKLLVPGFGDHDRPTSAGAGAQPGGAA